MNHAKLHKTSRFKRNEAESSDGEVSRRSRRRSIVQKGERNDIVSKMRKLSPLKETSNATKKAMISREERLKIWKKEKAKRLLKVKANAKPAFRVGTGSSFKNISVESKELSTNKENKKKSNLPKEKLPKPQKDIPCTSSVVTRQQKKDFKNIKKADKPKQKIPVRNKKTSAKKGGVEVQLKQDKGDQEGSSAGKKNDSDILVKEPSCSKDPVEESKLSSSDEERKTSQGECSEPAKPCEVSFAPGNFTFQVPASLNKFVFPDVFPNPDSKNTSDVKGNYLSSTPNNNVSGQKNDVGPVIPLALTSESEERVTYFRELVRSESESLNASCEYWNGVKQSNETELNEEVLGEIRSVIGQAQLLIAERFNQFCKLIDNFENKPEEGKPVLATDLQGFWDMIYYQVVDVANKFTELRELKENKWNKESNKETETKKMTKPVTRRKSGKSVAEKKCIETAGKTSKDKQNTPDKNDGDEIPTVKLHSGSDSDVQQCGSGVLLDSLDNSPTNGGSIDMKYLIPCDTSCIDTPEQAKPDSETRTLSATPPTFLHSTAATEGFFNTPGNSPAHVLRSRRIAPCSSGMSPFLRVKSAVNANVQNVKPNDSTDLISFSPVGTASEYNRGTSGPLTRQTTIKGKDESFSLI